MAKNVTTAASVRDLSKAVERTQTIVKLLQRKGGMTAEALRDAVGAVTKHNSWSLARMGEMFGYSLSTTPGSEFKDGLMRYRFDKVVEAARAARVKPTAQPEEKRAAAATVAAAPSKRAARKADGKKAAAKNRGSR